MAAIVYQTNKKTGVVYAYESISYWGQGEAAIPGQTQMHRQGGFRRPGKSSPLAEEGKRPPPRMANLQEELESGRLRPDHEKQYAKYFHVKTTPVRGTRVEANEEAHGGGQAQLRILHPC